MKSYPSDKNQYPAFIRPRRLLAVFVVFVGVSVSFFVCSEVANAGILSFLQSLIKNETVSAQSSQIGMADSQTSAMIVLQASANVMNSAQSQDLPPFENDTTLSPDVARMNATSTENINTQISIYVVRTGDTISEVAKMFNVSVNTVLWANSLSSKSVLQPGQTLVILPVTGVTHKIVKNDSIESIAKKYKADISDILNYNDLTLKSILKIGDEILIPDAEISTVAIISQSNRLSGSISGVSGGNNQPSFPGYYSCPVPGAHLSQKLHGHNGVDLASSRGTPVRAASDGTIIVNRSNGAWNGGYGNFIVILHENGTQTLYSHLSRSIIQSGEVVSKNQTIGYVGMTGLTTGPHLHFEIRGARNPFTDVSLCR